MDPIRAVVASLLILVSGLMIGAIISYLRIYHGQAASDLFSSGPWYAYDFQDSESPSRAQLGRITIHNPLSLRADEAEYFFAYTDSDDNALNSSCRYRVAGAVPDSSWWHLSAYDKRGYLILSHLNNPSYSSASHRQFKQGRFEVMLATEEEVPQLGNALPVIVLPSGNRPFNLLLRIYRPERTYMNAEAAATLPAIRADCAPPRQPEAVTVPDSSAGLPEPVTAPDSSASPPEPGT